MGTSHLDTIPRSGLASEGMVGETIDGFGDSDGRPARAPSHESRRTPPSLTARRTAVLYWISAVLLVGLGFVLIGDRPGLRVEYYPLTPNWEGSPVFVDIGQPQVLGPEDLRPLVSKKIFSVRWRGWLVVETSGEYLFRFIADQGGYLILNGERTSKKQLQVALERGVHAIEIGFNQTRGHSRLRVRWTPPGGELAPLPAERLHARRPVWLHHLLRDILAPVARPYRQLIGVLAVLVAFLLIRMGLRSAGLDRGERAGTSGGSDRRDRRVLYAGFFVGLFVLCWLWTTRFTAPLLGGDDVRYVYKALFPAKGDWFFFRYAHVYLLKAFIWLRDGDGFLGSRTYWSFMFSVTVTALALGCRALGPRLQLRTVAVTLFVLISQGSLLGLAGGAFADYTTMMFVTLAVVVYLHALRSEPSRGRVLWHELAIGALTVAAVKSKETGIILAWLPLLFLWTEGRIDLRGFGRKMSFWIAGAAAALLVLMSLDAWLLGDFWYSVTLDPGSVTRIHFRRETGLLASSARWTRILWAPGAPAPLEALRYSWLLALAAPAVATLRRKRVELRILFLMPLAYLLLLIAIYAWAPHTFSKRHMYPILPMCCLAVGALFYWLGLEDRSWRQLLAPRAIMPFVVGSAVLILLINPTRTGAIDPSSALGVRGVWVAWLLLAATIALLLASRARPAWMIILLLALFGPGFAQVHQNLAKRYQLQRGELILYPWETFREEIEDARPESVAVAPEIWNSYRMVGKRATRQTIARIFFRRQDLRIPQVENVGPDVSYAIAGPIALPAWYRQIPDLRATAVFDSSGRLALVRPSDPRKESSD